ncbi:exported hypothetical protein [Syntrophobacter sp. SbD1]|nr:exported hypothetical protein [Syntrophobacter sp. SbD1]
MKASLLKKIAKGGLILGASVFAFAGAADAATYINLYGATAQYNFWTNYGCTYLMDIVGCGGCTGPYITSDNNSSVVVGTSCPSALANVGNLPPQDGTQTSSNDYLPDSTSLKTSGLTAVPSTFTADGSSTTIYFSYSNKASWDGVDSVLGVYDAPNNGYGNPCSEGTTDNSNGFQRPVATCNGPGTTGAGSACGTVGSKGSAIYVCQPIHFGTSDVESTAFIQKSTGYVLGPNHTGSVVTHNFGTGGISVTSAFNLPTNTTINYTSVPLPVSGTYSASANAVVNPNGVTGAGIPATAMLGGTPVNQPETPLAYPFSFYVNPGVKSYRCNAAGANGYSQWSGYDQLCYDDSWCGGTAGVGGQFGGANALCTAQTIDNLTRLQAVALFSGQITNWNQFGSDFWPSKAVALCFRHAGSGTMATLDWGVMYGNGWGTHPVSKYNPSVAGVPKASSSPFIYFNNGTGDMKNCLNWANADATASGGNYDANPTDAGGGVGYMDSDNADATDYKQVKYNGVRASRIAMHDGVYDDFWTINRMYTPAFSTSGCTGGGYCEQPLIDLFEMMVYAINQPGDILNSTVGTPRGATYGASSELNFYKGTSSTYPSVNTGTSTPASPD